MANIVDAAGAAKLLAAAKGVLILAHINPDGDTLGGGYALCRALRDLGKNARVLCADEASHHFDHLSAGLAQQDFEPDFITATDIAAPELLGKELKARYLGHIDLIIDHHTASNTGFAAHMFLKEAAANAENIYDVISALGVTVTPEIAACLYTGIITDTGCFRFQNTTADTHRIAAKLMETGFDYHGLNYKFFDFHTKNRVALESYAYGHIEYFYGGKVAMIALPKNVLKDVDSEDINGLSALPRSIEGVEVGILLKEKDTDFWKASLRSANNIDVSKICAALGGGGHRRAAGCTLFGNKETVTEKLLNAVNGVTDGADGIAI